ncbi:MAG: efflux RND transporter periplasmic adaptor subunit [Pseudomonadota bacterium]|nr:efflux RND transporter periplasmic adaptor subunit [Pseudomonadota bacterium]
MISKRFFILLAWIALSGCESEKKASGLFSGEENSWNIANIVNRDIVVSVQAAGIIEPVTTVEIKSKASGEILDIMAETGDVVEAGDLLVQIDKRTPRNALAQAEAELEAAIARRDITESSLIRSEKLFKSGTVNRVDYERGILEAANSKAEAVRAQVAVENARIALDDTEVRSPIRGTLIQRDVEEGQVISSPTMDVGGGTALLRMADLRSVQVRALVDESDIGKIQQNQIAVVTVAAYPNQPFEGEVLKVEPKAEDEETVTLFAVIVNIDNLEGLLKPGMNAEVEIDIASRFGVAAIPSIALRTQKDIRAASMFTGIDMNTIREQLRGASKASETKDRPGSNGQRPSRNSEGAPNNRASRPATNNEPLSQQGYLFGGNYWAFVIKDDTPVAINIETGLTDLDYSEVISGVDTNDQILMMPSSDLILSRDEFRKFVGGMSSVPGVNQSRGN